MPARQAVAGAFGRAARDYDSHADLQLAAARQLAGMVADEPAPSVAADLGCGTAPLSWQFRRQWPHTRWLGLDIAEPMLREGITRGRLDADFAPVLADAMQLPLPDGGVDLLYSSFALQWCLPLERLATELARVLRPGGVLALSLPVDGTLAELKHSWAQVDDGIHVNRFASADDWQRQLTAAGLAVEQCRQLCVRQHYPDVRAIARMLKRTGAHHVDRGGAAAGLTTRSRLRRLEAAYECLREDGGLPLSWQVLYLTARREG